MLTRRARYDSLVKHAVEKRKPVLLLNIGPTRADQLLGIETIDIPAGSVIRDVVKKVLCVAIDASLVFILLCSSPPSFIVQGK